MAALALARAGYLSQNSYGWLHDGIHERDGLDKMAFCAELKPENRLQLNFVRWDCMKQRGTGSSSTLEAWEPRSGLSGCEGPVARNQQLSRRQSGRQPACNTCILISVAFYRALRLCILLMPDALTCWMCVRGWGCMSHPIIIVGVLTCYLRTWRRSYICASVPGSAGEQLLELVLDHILGDYPWLISSSREEAPTSSISNLS